MKRILLIAMTLFFNVLFAASIAIPTGLPVLPTAGVIVGTSLLMPSMQGVAYMGVQREIWIGDIVGNLFQGNPFIDKAINHDQYVLAGKIVHIPNAGAKPGVAKNRTQLPATVLRRDDIDIYYVLDEFTSDPLLITNAETAELSYDKRSSILAETKEAINEIVGSELLYKWAPTVAAQYIRTSGASVAAHTSGATGVRRLLTVEDIAKVKKLMNEQGIPMEGRCLMLDSEMYSQLCADLRVTQFRDFSVAYNPQTGTVDKLEGFIIMQRPYVLRYTNDGTPVLKTPDAVGVATDHGAALAWHPTTVARALGNHDFFERLNDPTYYGDIYSALLRVGGRKMRDDQKGVVALIQDTYIPPAP